MKGHIMSSAEEMEILKDHPEGEDYRMLIENAWKDLHHSRLQEWSSLVVVAGVHLAAIQIVRYSDELKNLISVQYLSTTAFAIGTFFALIGAAITCRHRKIMSTKMSWIKDAEKKLGLMKPEQNNDAEEKLDLMKPEQNNYGIINPKDVKVPSIRPRFGSVSFFILMFYVIFVIVDMVIISGLFKG